MTSFLARELQRQNGGVTLQRIPSTRRICNYEHLHPISANICSGLLTDVKEVLKEAESYQRLQEELLEKAVKQAQLAVDMLKNPRIIPSPDFTYAEDVKFCNYIIKVSTVLKRALPTLDDEYKSICPWSLILKVNFTDLCPHQPFCKHKQKYTQSQVPAGHPHPPGGTIHSDVMGFCQDDYAVQPGKTKPEGCKVKKYCALRHKEDCSGKANRDAIILYAVACLHRDGLWE